MSVPTQQRALAVLTKRGAWGVIPTDVEQPGPGEILVRVEAAGLNPIDWKVQASEYSDYRNEYPAIVGLDSAGVVVALGEGVTAFVVGDRVLHQGYFTNRLATFKQYTLIPADIAAKIPDTLSFDEAASIPTCLSTASIGLFNKAELGGAGLVAPFQEGGRGKYAGQAIVVFGGSSSVGQFVIQLARLAGFSYIITTVSPRNNALAHSLGATHTIDRNLSSEAIAARVKHITSDPVKIVFDAISHASTQLAAYDMLAPRGTLVVVLPPALPAESLAADKRVVRTLGSVHAPNNRAFGREVYACVTGLLASGDIKPNAVEVLPGGLMGIIEGLQRMQRDEVSAHKLIGHPQETLLL